MSMELDVELTSLRFLQSEKQRDIWAPVLILILSKVVAFSDDRVCVAGQCRQRKG